MVVSAGVDVCKANLDVSISQGPLIRFDNTAKGHHQAGETLDRARTSPWQYARLPSGY